MKKIIWTSLITVVIVISAALLGLRELTYAQMPDLKAAAAYALDHSALTTIEKVKVYTGGPKCYVFYGEDKLGRKLVTFATKDSVLAIEYLDKGMKEQQITEKARQNLGFVKIDKVTPGIVNPTEKSLLQTKAKLVWEIYGTNEKGEKQYTYLDFYQGQELWTYVLLPGK